VNIIQITPGAGPMFCGNCLRDNALVTALRNQGHQVLMIPLYLPLTLDEEDQSADMPIFFSGINVYLEQKSAWFRRAPGWLHRLLTARSLLKWAGGKAAKTRAADVGELALSMLRGQQGNQARELNELCAWLNTQPKPDVICLSNALLLGMARSLKSDFGVPIVCTLQGEDTFLDALPESHRAQCWQTMAEAAKLVELFVAPSHYFGELMRKRLGLPAERVRIVHNGINLSGYGSEEVRNRGLNQGKGIQPAAPPNGGVIGYFTRMCREKGLDVLVRAYIALRQRNRLRPLRLHIGGSCGPADQNFVDGLRDQLRAAGVLEDVAFFPNPDRNGKLSFLRSVTVFSVPAVYGEAFGLYVIEAMASGVPVVQPRTAAFTELIEMTGGGLLCAPGDPESLADRLEELLLDPARATALGEAGRRAVFERFSAQQMAKAMLEVYKEATVGRQVEAMKL
jgi:glycosyltransferase involved in cell wall biosynthesis